MDVVTRVFISLLSQMFCIVLFLFCMHSWFAKTQIIFLPNHSNFFKAFELYWWVENGKFVPNSIVFFGILMGFKFDLFAQYKIWIDIFHLFYERKIACPCQIPQWAPWLNPCIKQTTNIIMERCIFLSIYYFGGKEPKYSRTFIQQGLWDHENYLVISGFSLYQDKKTKKYKELGPAKWPCYKRVLLYPTYL